MSTDLLLSDAVKLRRIERLSALTREMMSHLGVASLDDQLQRIAEAAREILEAETCGIFLVKDEDGGLGKELSLEASAGHREGGFDKGKRMSIRSCDRGGLTSHIAHEGRLFNAFGAKLVNHHAVANKENFTQVSHTLSGRCFSLLALPLKKKQGRRKSWLAYYELITSKDRTAGSPPTAVSIKSTNG